LFETFCPLFLVPHFAGEVVSASLGSGGGVLRQLDAALGFDVGLEQRLDAGQFGGGELALGFFQGFFGLGELVALAGGGF